MAIDRRVLMLIGAMALAVLLIAAAVAAAPPYYPYPFPQPHTHNAIATVGAGVIYEQNVNVSTLTTETFPFYGMQTGRLPPTYDTVEGNIALRWGLQPHFPGEEIHGIATTGIGFVGGEHPEAPFVWLYRARVTAGSAAFLGGGYANTEDAATGVALGDLDGDGDLDVFAAYGSAPGAVLLNAGRGLLVDSGQALGAYASGRAALGDLDRDGDLDAVVVGPAPVWRNDGAGTFTRITPDPGLSGAYDVALADFNGDGALDAAFAGSGGNRIWFNDGNGEFTDSGQSLGAYVSRGVAPVDVEPDGDLDLVFANYHMLSVDPNTIWLNDGAGGFVQAAQTLGAGISMDVAVGDADGALGADVYIFASSGDSLWLNDGTGGFVQGAHATSGSVAAGTLADLDGDGDLDVWRARSAGDEVWLNDGSGAFTDSGARLAPGNGRAVDVGDLDGDGDLDALTGSSTAPVRPWFNWAPDAPSASALPAPGSHRAPVTTSLTVTVGGAVGAGSATSATVVVRGGFRGRLDGMLAVSGDEIVFAPAGPALPGELLAGTVTTGVVAGGQPLARPFVWQVRAAVDRGSSIFEDTEQAFEPGESTAVTLGDLDGDGDLDAVIANEDRANSVWFNDGTGVMTDTAMSLDAVESYQVALGDLDNDGDLDLFVANGYDPNPNTVWLNDGTGILTDTGQALGSGISRDAALGDLDGDGDLDALVGDSDGCRVWINDGSGAFDDSRQRLGADRVFAVALGDLDGDGDLDAAVASGVDPTPDRVWLNDGSGLFVEKGAGLGAADSRGVDLGDLDGDGDLDLYLAHRSDPDTVWWNDGAGAFTDSGQSLGDYLEARVTLADLDGDGDLDALVGTPGGAVMWLNDGTGTLTAGPTLGAGLVSDTALGDLDGDGDLDALLARSTTLRAQVWRNLDPVEVDPVVDPERNSHTAPVTTTVTIDLPGTIDPTSVTSETVVVHGGQHGRLSGTYGVGSIVFTPTVALAAGEPVQATLTTGVRVNGRSLVRPTVWQFRTETLWGTALYRDTRQRLGNSASYDVDLGDLDGDGDLDAYVANDGANRVWLNDGEMGFVDSGQALGSSLSGHAALGDLDGDGDLDAWDANATTDQIWFNDGTGAFAPSSQTLDYHPGWSVALADLDGDGDLDAASACNGPDIIWLNDGKGAFTDSGQQLGSANSADIVAGDLDGDGDLDLYVTTSGSMDQVWLNNGRGVFNDTGQTLSDGAGLTADLGDVDLDGDLDAVVAPYTGYGEIWLNDGHGMLSLSAIFDDPYEVWDVVLGDADSDGDLDVWFSDLYGGGLWLNDGTGGFPGEGRYAISDVALALGDLDRDGDLDAFAAGYDSAPHSVWENVSRFPPTASGLPAPGSADATPTTTVTVTVGGSVTPGTVSTETVTVYGHLSGWRTGTFSFGPGSDPFNFRPAAPFFAGERVAAMVTQAIEVDGAPLPHPYGWEFRTGVTASAGRFVDSGQALGDQASTGVVLGDLDGDGDLDVIVTNYLGLNRIWRNDGRGGFTLDAQTLGDTLTRGVALADVDRDGDLDALVASYAGNRLWRNDGAGIFTVDAQNLSVGALARVGDLDGDGDLDVIWGRPATVFLNDGAGQFAANGELGNLDGNDLALGDVDGDGDLDLFLPFSLDPGGGRVWFNNGKAQFVQGLQTLPQFDVLQGIFGDLDGDGDLDLVTGDTPEGYVLFNDSLGAMTDSGETIPSPGETGLSLGDLDGDGDLDLLVLRQDDGESNEIYWNDGAGTFTPGVTMLGSAASKAAALGDLDGDGDLDAFIANYDQPNQVWFNQNEADLALGKTAQPAIIRPGDWVTFTLTYTNTGPQIATGVEIADHLPVTLTDASYVATGAALSATSGPTYTWHVANLAPGTGGIITITARLAPAFSGAPATLTNCAAITGTVHDTASGNNTDDAVVSVVPPALDAPVLLLPADGSTTGDPEVTLVWAPVVDAAGYLLDWNGSVSDVGAVTQTVVGPLATGAYTWTVAAYDVLGVPGPFAAAWTLAVDRTPPGAPVLLSPPTGALTSTATPLLRWSPVADATGYVVWWGEAEVNVGAVTQHVAGPAADGAYEWTVAAYDAAGNRSPVPTPAALTIDTTPPAVPVLVSPADGAVLTGTVTPVTLIWQPVADAVAYRLVWQGTPVDLGGVTTYDVGALAEGVYTWQVAARDLAGNWSALSGSWAFEVRESEEHRIYLPLGMRSAQARALMPPPMPVVLRRGVPD